MIELRAAKGLGDALHLRAVALHLLGLGEAVTVYTGWPEVFSGLRLNALPLQRATPTSRTITYALSHPLAPGADRFVMGCRKAGIESAVDLRLDWVVRNPRLVAQVLRASGGRGIVLFQPRKIAATEEERWFSPGREALARVLRRERLFRVRVGHPAYVYDELAEVADLDLFGATSATDVLDLGACATGFVCEPCYLLVLAEALRKPVTCVFPPAASSGKARNVTPARFLHRPELSTAVIDDGGRHAVA